LLTPHMGTITFIILLFIYYVYCQTYYTYYTLEIAIGQAHLELNKEYALRRTVALTPIF
jgi:hypothetical protein